MTPRLLDAVEFRTTFSAPMREIGREDVTPHIWRYVESIPEQGLGGHRSLDRIAHVYRNGAGTFDHVLIPISTSNTYLVVVFDVSAQSIFGHRVLDLNREYGLSDA